MPKYFKTPPSPHISTSLPRYLFTSLPRYFFTSLLLYFFASLLFFVPQASAANLGLTPATTTLSPNQTTTITVGLNTAGKNTVGVDALINYDPTLLEIQSVSFTGSPYAHNFSNISASTVKLTSTFTSSSDSYNGTTNLATVTVKALKSGSAVLGFTCNPGATNDTNIVERLTGNDIVDCGSLNSPSITIAATNQPSTPPSTPPTDNASTGNSNSTCTLPAAPTNLRSAPNSTDSVLLTWDHAVSGAEHYSLTYGPSQNQLYYAVGNIGYTNNFLVSHLSPNSTYTFGIASVNSCGQSSTSFTLNKTFGSSTQKTAAAANLATTSAFGNLVTQTKNTSIPDITNHPSDELSTTATPEPYTYTQPSETIQTRTMALIAIFLIPLFLLIFFLLKRLKKKNPKNLDSTDQNLPPVETLTPPPTTNTYSNQMDLPSDNPTDTQT